MARSWLDLGQILARSWLDLIPFYVLGNILCVWVFNKKDVELKPSFANLLKCLSVYDILLLVGRHIFNFIKGLKIIQRIYVFRRIYLFSDFFIMVVQKFFRT